MAALIAGRARSAASVSGRQTPATTAPRTSHSPTGASSRPPLGFAIVRKAISE
jgi:hypothetical protein